MRQYIAIENSSGRVIYITARDEEDAYVTIGVILYGMDRNTIDTGNVDVDLHLISPEYKQTAKYITPEKEQNVEGT